MQAFSMKIKYRKRPIHRLSSLLRVIRRDEEELREILLRRDTFYQPKEREKPGGGMRVVYDVNGTPLRGIMNRVKAEILDHVDYPTYLHGSIKGRSNKTNAESHFAKRGVTQDISAFFPSITEAHVFCVFNRGFHFSKKVSQILAKLLTHEGVLPQGAPTSSHIANLVFFNNEPAVVRKIEARGYRYTRYVDDIHVSSPSVLTEEEKTWIIRTVRQLFVPMGFKTNKEKLKMQHQFSPHTVTGLVVGETTTVPPAYVQKVYKEIDSLASKPEGNRDKHIGFIEAKIRYVAATHPQKGSRLNRYLEKAKAALN